MSYQKPDQKAAYKYAAIAIKIIVGLVLAITTAISLNIALSDYGVVISASVIIVMLVAEITSNVIIHTKAPGDPWGPFNAAVSIMIISIFMSILSSFLVKDESNKKGNKIATELEAIRNKEYNRELARFDRKNKADKKEVLDDIKNKKSSLGYSWWQTGIEKNPRAFMTSKNPGRREFYKNWISLKNEQSERLAEINNRTFNFDNERYQNTIDRNLKVYRLEGISRFWLLLIIDIIFGGIHLAFFIRPVVVRHKQDEREISEYEANQIEEKRYLESQLRAVELEVETNRIKREADEKIRRFKIENDAYERQLKSEQTKIKFEIQNKEKMEKQHPDFEFIGSVNGALPETNILYNPKDMVVRLGNGKIYKSKKSYINSMNIQSRHNKTLYKVMQAAQKILTKETTFFD